MNENDDTGFAPGLCRSEMKEKLPLLYWSYKRFKRLKIT
jgi:hypothetical protein